MNLFENSNFSKVGNTRSTFGLVLVIAGALLFFDRFLKTGWLTFIILPIIGVSLYLYGIRYRNPWLILSGGVAGGIGVGTATALSPLFNQNILIIQIGLLTLFSGIGWLFVVCTTVLLGVRPLWWGGIPASLLIGAGYCLIFRYLRWIDFVFYIAIGLGLAFLIWGLAEKLIGLVIPGCLIVSSGPAIYFAWRTPLELQNTLVSTGIMLVWLALGWALITISGRILVHRFIWWPLIPAGILAMVGWGLYIGGDPDNALGFISNTGSIGLMIFGLYLLLLRKGIHH